MPQVVSLQELIVRARQLANMVNSPFVNDSTELTPWMKAEVASTYDSMIKQGADDQFVVITSFHTTPGVTATPLPDDYYALKMAAYVGPSGAFMPFDKWQWADVARLSNAQSGAGRLMYRVAGTQSTASTPPVKNLLIAPAPTTALQIMIAYVPVISFIPQVGDGAILLDGVDWWLERAVIRVAIKMLQKQQSDVSVLRDDLAQIDERIAALAPELDTNRNECVSDTRGADALSCFPWGAT